MISENGTYSQSEGTVLSASEVQQQMAAMTAQNQTIMGETPPDGDLETRLSALLNNTQPEETGTEPVSQEAPAEAVTPDSLLKLRVDPVEAAELKTLNELLQKRYGLDAEAFEQRQRQTDAANEATAVKALQSEWGVSDTDFNSRLTQIREAFKLLPEDMQEALDNPVGARLIWNNIQSTQPKAQAAPDTQKSTGARTPSASQSQFLFTQSEIVRMTPAQYAANEAAVYQAYAQNKVDLNR